MIGKICLNKVVQKKKDPAFQTTHPALNIPEVHNQEGRLSLSTELQSENIVPFYSKLPRMFLHYYKIKGSQ